jgi:hypothetical protein
MASKGANPTPACPEPRMSKPLARLPIAALALLALATPVAWALDMNQGTRYALADPNAFRQSEPTMPARAAVPQATAKAKKAKPGKAKILANLNSYRTPAQQAVERISRPAVVCPPTEAACPSVYRGSIAKSQSWRHAPSQRQQGDSALDRERTQAPRDETGSASAQSGIPGLAPGIESNYKFSYNVPIGPNEQVQLQARVRKNAYNTLNSSDSTLRADWSLRF